MSAPVFTQFDLLDPTSMRAKLETAHGSDVWDQWSMLDTSRAESQLNALSASPPFVPLRGLYDTRWTPGSASAPNVNWSLADSIGAI
jgi:hypothetical protein